MEQCGKRYTLAVIVMMPFTIKAGVKVRQNNTRFEVKYNTSLHYDYDDATLMNCTLKYPANMTSGGTLTLTFLKQTTCTEKLTKLEYFCSAINVNKSNADMANGIFLIILMVLGITGNTIVCVIIARDARLRSKVINWFLFSLAVNDTLLS